MNSGAATDLLKRLEADPQCVAAFLCEWCELSPQSAIRAAYHLENIMVQYRWDLNPDRQWRVKLLTRFLNSFTLAETPRD